MSRVFQSNGADPAVNELRVTADVNNLQSVMSFLQTHLDAQDCPRKARMAIELAVEEVFVNIAMYAYVSGNGEVTVRICPSGDGPADETAPEGSRGIEVTFIDQGIPYDPLAREDPDVTLPANQRRIGGLGIFLIKQQMDDVTYEHRDGSNILTLKKQF